MDNATSHPPSLNDINDLIDVEKAGLIDKGTISYIANDITNPADTNTYIKGIENLVSNLQVLIVNLKNVSSGIKPSTAIKPSSEIKPCLSSIQQSETISDTPAAVPQPKNYAPNIDSASVLTEFFRSNSFFRGHRGEFKTPPVQRFSKSFDSNFDEMLHGSSFSDFARLLRKRVLQKVPTGNRSSVQPHTMGLKIPINSTQIGENTLPLIAICIEEQCLGEIVNQPRMIDLRSKNNGAYNAPRLDDIKVTLIEGERTMDPQFLVEQAKKARRQTELRFIQDSAQATEKSSSNKKRTTMKRKRVMPQMFYTQSLQYSRRRAADEQPAGCKHGRVNGASRHLLSQRSHFISYQTAKKPYSHTIQMADDALHVPTFNNDVLSYKLKCNKLIKCGC
ncbi:unnamed protein product, partial [Meganyctiphanes norvegica]